MHCEEETLYLYSIYSRCFIEMKCVRYCTKCDLFFENGTDYVARSEFDRMLQLRVKSFIILYDIL